MVSCFGSFLYLDSISFHRSSSRVVNSDLVFPALPLLYCFGHLLPGYPSVGTGLLPATCMVYVPAPCARWLLALQDCTCGSQFADISLSRWLLFFHVEVTAAILFFWCADNLNAACIRFLEAQGRLTYFHVEELLFQFSFAFEVSLRITGISSIHHHKWLL